MKKKNKFYIKIFITIIIIFITISRNIFYYNTKKICTREIIFGLISELSVDKTFTFFKSLQKVKYDGKIIVFVDKKENCQYYNHLNIEYLYFNSNYPYYPVNHHLYPISTSFINNKYPNFTEIKKNYVVFLWILRYYLIYSFITHYGNDKDTYLFSDIKDVIFQKNPFNC